MKTIHSLPGFRDIYPNEKKLQNYIFNKWKKLAKKYNFHEYDAPLIEPSELYKKKSGDEITEQLFIFKDKGGREVAMRPEMTPSITKMICAKEKNFKKPIKWFSIVKNFRYEKPQKGRLREFFQFNCDIFGENSPETDAEIIALAIESIKCFGFTQDDFVVKISNRKIWDDFLNEKKLNEKEKIIALNIIDKIEKYSEKIITAELQKNPKISKKIQYHEIISFITSKSAQKSHHFKKLIDNLEYQNLAQFTKIDLSIVRGLAYYQGTVFEITAKNSKLRAIAGGGRYDGLCETISNGKCKLPAIGFAIGDVPTTIFIQENKNINDAIQKKINYKNQLQVFVIAEENNENYKRKETLNIVQKLRNKNITCDYSTNFTLSINKQMKLAISNSAKYMLIINKNNKKYTLKEIINSKKHTLTLKNIIEIIKNNKINKKTKKN